MPEEIFSTWNPLKTKGSHEVMLKMGYVTWLTEEAGIGRVYDSLDFSWHDTIPLSQTNVLKTNGEVDHAVLLHETDRALPANAANFTPASLGTDDAAIYQRLTAAHPQIIQELNGPNGLQTGPTGTVSGTPAETNFYRIIGHRLDSDDDSLPDLLEATLSGVSPYDPDTDGDGVTDPWSLGSFTAPIISEFMATNDNTLFDEDEDDSDWVEIFNPTNTTFNLSGWQLLDFNNTWTFPIAPTADPSQQLILTPGETLIVFASDKNRIDPLSELHTNFKLGSSGDSLTLRKPDPNGPGYIIVDQHTFGNQRKNTSGGWAFNAEDGTFATAGGFADLRYFVDPSPGLPNPPSTCPGLSTAPDISPAGTLFPSGAGPVTVVINPPDLLPQTLVYYTLDGSDPDEDSTLYAGSFLVTESTIVRVVALQSGCIPSPITARSYLFTDSILGTSPIGQEPTDAQKRPLGWPSEAVGAQAGERLVIGDLDFAIDPLVVADHRATLEQELLGHPLVSITGPLAQIFGLDSGMYANSTNTGSQPDPQANDWWRLISFEYHDPADQNNYRQENAEVTITGGTSRAFTATSKHNLRFRFRSRFSRTGESGLDFEESPFFAADTTFFKNLLLRNPTHDSWLLKWQTSTPFGASYIRGGWLQSLHAEMGLANNGLPHLEPHRRWVHVFLNGLYWGAHELTERVDGDFAKSYLNLDDDYDVFKFSGNTDDDIDQDGDGIPDMSHEERVNLTDGDYKAWSVLRNHCLAAASDPADSAAWLAVLDFLDLDNYLDYLLVQMYSNVRDWPGKNYRIVRRRGQDEHLIGNPAINPGGKFQFVAWDAEQSLGTPVQDQVYASTGVAEFHSILLAHPTYRQAFRDRLDLHFNDAGGILTPVVGGGLNPGYQLFQTEMDRFGGIRDTNGAILTPGLLTAESARWGDGNPDLPFSLGYEDHPGPGIGWKGVTDKIRDQHDTARRQNFLDAVDIIFTPPPVNPE